MPKVKQLVSSRAGMQTWVCPRPQHALPTWYSAPLVMEWWALCPGTRGKEEFDSDWGQEEGGLI